MVHSGTGRPLVAYYFMVDFELAQHMEYRLVLARCCSHKVNLIVQIAICRQRMQNPIQGNHPPPSLGDSRLYLVKARDICECRPFQQI